MYRSALTLVWHRQAKDIAAIKGDQVSADFGSQVHPLPTSAHTLPAGERHCSDPRKVDVRLPGQGNSNSYGARPVHQIVSMMRWFRTSRLSRKNSLSLCRPPWPSRMLVDPICMWGCTNLYQDDVGQPRVCSISAQDWLQVRYLYENYYTTSNL